MSTSTLVTDIHPASWHADRALGVGGSEAASLFSAGPFACTKQLAYIKRGHTPDYHRTAAEEKMLKRGVRLEDIVASEFAAETGLTIRRVKARVSKSHPHARVNMDRQIVAVDPQHLHRITQDANGFSPLASILLDPGVGYLEVKTMNTFDFARIRKEGLTKHDHYLLQLQMGMAVTGYRWGVFAILDTSTFDLLWFPMLRNDELCTLLLDRTEEFWDTYILDPTHELPAPVAEGDKRCSKCLFRRSCRGEAYLEKHAGADFSTDYVLAADPEITELAHDYLAADEAADAASAIVDTIKARLKEKMAADGTPKLIVPDVIRFCLTTSAGRKSWDGKAIEGEINALIKGATILDPAQITPEQMEAALPVVAKLLPAIAKRIAACQKVGAGSTTFRTFAA